MSLPMLAVDKDSNSKGDCKVRNVKLDNRKVFFLFICLFIIVDQLIKLVVWSYFMEVNKYPLIEGVFYFAPIINKDLTYVHALFNLPVNTMAIIAMNILIVLFFFNIYRYLFYKIKLKNALALMVCLFAISGSICSMLDKLLWGGSLDFLYIERLFICDLKDMYLFFTMFLVLIFVLINQNIVKKIKAKDFFLFCFRR